MLIERTKIEDKVLNNKEQNRTRRIVSSVINFLGFEKALSTLPDSAEVAEYCQKVIEGLDLKVDSNKLPECLNKDQKEGVLIYGDHAFVVGPFLLISKLLESGRDFRIVGYDSILKSFPDELHYLFITIMPAIHAIDAQLPSSFSTKLIAQLRRNYYGADETRNETEITTHTLEGLEQAAQFLDKGGVVVIFPAGSHDIQTLKNWKSGIGRLLNFVKRPDNVLLQPFSLTKINMKLLFLRFFWKYRLGGHPATKNVQFIWGGTKKLDQELSKEGKSSKRITQRLAADYIQEFSETNVD